MDTCMFMAESFCCEPEIMTTLLISCIPKQNKKLKKKRKKNITSQKEKQKKKRIQKKYNWKTRFKMAINIYLSIVTLKVNRLFQ